MKQWWRKWSYEIPLSIGDALWEVLVVRFAAFLDRLTLRKVVEFVAIAILVMAFAQTLPFDLAILFAGDALMYLEFVVAIRLAVAWMHIRQAFDMAVHLTRLAMRALKAAVGLPVRAYTWLRERRSARRLAKPRETSDGSEDGSGFGWGVPAFA